MTRLFYLIPVLVFAGFAALVFNGMRGGENNTLPSTMVGKTAPKISVIPFSDLPTLGEADLKSGQVSLVNFWASWCAPCRAEHPNLMAISEAGVPVFGVNYRDDPAKAQAFLNELGNPYVAGGADPIARMALDWGVYGLPETFVIGSDGKIIARVAGPVTQRNIKSRIETALSSAGETWSYRAN